MLLTRSATENLLGLVIGWMPASFNYFEFSFFLLFDFGPARESENWPISDGLHSALVKKRSPYMPLGDRPKTSQQLIIIFIIIAVFISEAGLSFRFCGHRWHQSGNFPSYDSPTGAVWQFNSKCSHTGYRVVAGSSMCSVQKREDRHIHPTSHSPGDPTPYTLY